MAIQSFADKEVKMFFYTGRCAKECPWAPVAQLVRRKLDMVHYAKTLSDLRSPPGNRLEALRGSLRGRQSVRVNDRWRIVLRWTPAGPHEVDVCDYH